MDNITLFTTGIVNFSLEHWIGLHLVLSCVVWLLVHIDTVYAMVTNFTFCWRFLWPWVSFLYVLQCLSHWFVCFTHFASVMYPNNSHCEVHCYIMKINKFNVLFTHINLQIAAIWSWLISLHPIACAHIISGELISCWYPYNHYRMVQQKVMHGKSLCIYIVQCIKTALVLYSVITTINVMLMGTPPEQQVTVL